MSAGIVVIVVNAASCLSVRVRLSLKSKAAVGPSLPPPRASHARTSSALTAGETHRPSPG